MNEPLIYFAIFVAVYIIDLLTALLHRKMRPNNFKRTESNLLFVRCLEQKGIIKGVFAYMILSTTKAILLFISIGIAAKIIFNATISGSLMFAFLLLTIFHILGISTNIIALFKKDRKPRAVIPPQHINKMEAQK